MRKEVQRLAIICWLAMSYCIPVWAQLLRPALREIPQTACLHREGGKDTLLFPGVRDRFDTLYIYI